jgi:hypothetical protein
MVDGAWVMRGGVIVAFDEPAMIREAQAHAAALRERVAGTSGCDAGDRSRIAESGLRLTNPWQHL